MNTFITAVTLSYLYTLCAGWKNENLCPQDTKCKCTQDSYLKEDPTAISVFCKQTTDPNIHLLPLWNITRIIFHSNTFTNLSTLHTLRKTRLHRLSMLGNKINGDEKKLTLFDWDWLPDTTNTLSLFSNGFEGFTSSQRRDGKCNVNRFPNISILVTREKMDILPSCLPERVDWLLFNEMDKIGSTTHWPSYITTIKLSRNGWSKTPSNFFVGAPNSLRTVLLHNQEFNESWPLELPVSTLELLTLNWCKISRMSEEEMARFRKADRLKYLTMSYNALTEISKNLPTSLNTLRIDNNKIEYVDPDVWKGMDNLLKLDMSKNLLTMVPLGMPPSLSTLILKENNIDHVSSRAFLEMKNLTMLDLSNNKLTMMPTGIQPGLNLYFLNGNQISLVPSPEAYTFCTQCNKMWVHNNPLVCNVNMIKMLAWFVLHNVTVSTLVYNHKMTPYCMRIPMEERANDREWIDEIIKYMRYYNDPPYNSCSYEIETLTCINAGLKTIPDRIPPSLTRLNISDNLGIQIPDYKFIDQQKLKKLILNNNSLTHIPYGLPQSLTSLYLQNNNITGFTNRDAETLKNLTYLINLYLENNQIKQLHASQLTPLVKLRWIGLAGNKLVCDCSMMSFAYYFEKLIPFKKDRKPFVIASYPTCNSPDSLIYRDIRRLRGQFSYGLKCAPATCAWNDDHKLMNCSASMQKNQDTLENIPFKLGVAPQFKENSYWTKLDLTGMKLTDNQIEFRNLTHLKTVILTDNLLAQVPYKGLPPTVEILILTDNRIEHLPEIDSIRKYLPKLQILDLQRNKIKYLSEQEISLLPLIGKVLLKDNPFICNCYLRLLVSWVHMNKGNAKLNKTYQLSDLKCYTEGGKTSFDILHITENDYCKTIPIKEIVGGIIGCFALITTVFIIINIYLQKNRKRREREEILLGFQDLVAHEELQADPETGIEPGKPYKYDAFVSYDGNSNDADFVLALLEEMEDKRGYKLCLNERDFIPGAGITDNIVECIGTSKRIILVLSKNFVCSPWCQYEVQMALAELHQRRRSKLLMSVMLEDISANENLAGSVKALLSLVKPIIIPNKYASPDIWKKFWEEVEAGMPATVKENEAQESDPFIRYK